MNVILINESSGKAWLRSRRVLSKFLPQLGSRVWAGAITAEGLADLKQALLDSKVSKSTAIVCHRVETRSRLSVLWQLGSKDMFDNFGRFAFKAVAAKRGFADEGGAQLGAKSGASVDSLEDFPGSADSGANGSANSSANGSLLAKGQQDPLQAWLTAVLRLSALTHDIGKSSAAFQAKLANGTGFEELRHELVSFLILAASAAPDGAGTLGKHSDQEWLSRIVQDPAQICASALVTDEKTCAQAGTPEFLHAQSPWLQGLEAWKNHITSVAADAVFGANAPEGPDEIEVNPFDRPDIRNRAGDKFRLLTWGDLHQTLSSAPTLGLVLWLVLTHHRLPTSGPVDLNAAQHVNVDGAPASSCLRAPADAALDLPWLNPGWKQAVKIAAAQALEALKALEFKQPKDQGLGNSFEVPVTSTDASGPPEEKACASTTSTSPTLETNLSLLAAHLLRPLLILADHLGSKASEVTANKRDHAARKGRLFANTKGSDFFGDSLNTHLVKVSFWTRQLLLLARQDIRALPRAQAGQALLQPSHGKFAWQQELQEACAQLPRTPTFVAVLAETGAGKTLGACKVLMGLQGSESLRATYATSMRSLTSQAGKALVEQGGLSPKDVQVAIGNAHTQRLNEESVSSTSDSSLARTGVQFPPAPPDEVSGQDLGSSLALWGSESSDSVDNIVLDPEFGALGSAAELGTGLVDPLEQDHEQMSDVVLHEDRFLELVGSKNARSALRAHWGDKTLKLLSTPLLVCTVDHLIYSAAPSRGGETKLYLRNVHSDLVLDEIDSYSPADLPALAKLVFVAGLHSRNLIVLSATASPPILEGLYAAWRAGLAACVSGHKAGQGKDQGSADSSSSFVVPHNIVMGSSRIAPSALSNVTYKQFREEHQKYTNKVIEDLQARAEHVCQSRKLKTLEIAHPPKTAETVAGEQHEAAQAWAFDQVFNEAMRMHSAHGTDLVSLPGRPSVKISTGFIKLSTAKRAFDLTKYLSEKLSAARTPGTAQANQAAENNWPEVRLVAYHSKYPAAYLAEINARLTELCTRKVSSENPLAHPNLTVLKDTLLHDERVLKNPAGVCVLVCTTSLIETGRDYDFDFAVCEPNSERGLIQAAGRVRRHRGPAELPEANIALMSQPLNSLREQPHSRWWSGPGPDDLCEPIARLRVNVAQPKRGIGKPKVKQPLIKLAEEALPVAQWRVALDAQACLQDRRGLDYAVRGRIGHIEQASQHAYLLGSPSENCGLVSAAQYLSPPESQEHMHALSLNHVKKYRFRKSGGVQETFIPPGLRVNDDGCLCDTSVKYVNNQDDVVRKARSAQVLEGLDPKNFLLPEITSSARARIHACFATTASRNDIALTGASLRLKLPRAGGSIAKVTWSELLGFREE